MTNDELEAIRKRLDMHFQDGCYRSPRADYLCDVPALLDEVERLQEGHEIVATLAALSEPTTDSGRLDAEAGGWRPIESAPRDGTEFIATVRVFSNSAFSHHDTHIVAVDDETGGLANHYEQGWRLEDYEFWRPLPAPPTTLGGEN